MTFEFDAEKYKEASPHQKQWGKKLIFETFRRINAFAGKNQNINKLERSRNERYR